METIGSRVRRLRKEQGVTQTELAKRAGLSQGTINDLESGRSKGSQHIVALAAALGVTPSYLTVGKTSMPSTTRVDTPSGSVLLIPRLNVNGSAGRGAHTPDHEVVLDTIPMPKWWVSVNMPNLSSPMNLAVITAYGDSMEDTFSDGDLLFVDTGARMFDVDGVFVFDRGGEIYVKRIHRQFDGNIKIISDNKQKYEAFSVGPKELSTVNVRARVRFAWNGRRL